MLRAIPEVETGPDTRVGSKVCEKLPLTGLFSDSSTFLAT